MIDAEVMRLRRLRSTVLKARSLARQLDLSSSRRNSVFSRSAVSCWRIARIVTGRLRAHPYLNYQRDASDMAALCYRLSARLTAIASVRWGSSLQTFSAELMRVARELDNTRALTWSADLSDTLGRLQTEIRRSLDEAGAGARKEADSLSHTVAAAENSVGVARNTDAGLEANWPYLAI